MNQVQAPTAALRTMQGGFDEVDPGLSALAVMGLDGDTKTIWDKSKPAEVDAAKVMFDALRAKSYLAFKVKGNNGDKGEQVTEFDPNEERYIMVPPMQGG